MTVQMQIYPQSAGVAPSGVVTLCMTPGTPRFRVAFLRQAGAAALAYVTTPEVADLRFVTRLDAVTFASAPISSPAQSDLDYAWPQISFRVPAAWDSGVYFAAAYPVDASGNPTDALGTAIVGQQDIVPVPPLADGLALFVVRPAPGQLRKIAYIVAISTYQAYNDGGGGGYYFNPARYAVTWRRPGGGVGNPPRPQEADSYDPQSNRNTYMHWDAKFIAWLGLQQIACDYYTSADLETGCLLAPGGATKAYDLMLSIGHDEYWSTPMCDAVSTYIQKGGNVAIFSGNTCYRPIAYDAGGTRTVMTRLASEWSGATEAPLIGTTSQAGAGIWYTGSNPGSLRPPAGLTVKQPSHWVFAGTGVTSTTVLAAGAASPTSPPYGRLAGYECDGILPGTSPSNVIQLATAALAIPPWEAIGGPATNPHNCDMIIYGPTATPLASTVVNVSTTDWARVLTDSTETDQPKLQTITLTIINTLSHTS